MEEESTANSRVSVGNDVQSVSLSSKLPRLSIQLANLIKILSDESAIKIIREINKKARVTDFYNVTSHLYDELNKSKFDQNILSERFCQIASELLTEISKFKNDLNESKKVSKVHFYTKNLSDTIEQFSKAVTNQIKKYKSQSLLQSEEFDVQSIISDSDDLFINYQSSTEFKLKKGKDSLTVDMVKKMIDSFQQYEEYQKSIWIRICSKDKNWTSDLNLPWSEQQFRFKGFLEVALHQLLFIAEFKDRISELEKHVKSLISQKNKIGDNDFEQKKPIAKFIFAKKKPFLIENIPIVGKAVEVPTATATPSQTEMMEHRITAFSDIAQQAKLCPKPYDKITQLRIENKRLNEVFNDGWVTSQQSKM